MTEDEEKAIEVEWVLEGYVDSGQLDEEIPPDSLLYIPHAPSWPESNDAFDLCKKRPAGGAGWICTRRVNHKGLHAAHYNDGGCSIGRIWR